MFRALINVSKLKAAYDDHHGLDQIVRASDTDRTLARPVALSNKPAGAPLRAAQAGTDKRGTRISRPDGGGRTGRAGSGSRRPARATGPADRIGRGDRRTRVLGPSGKRHIKRYLVDPLPAADRKRFSEDLRILSHTARDLLPRLP